MSGLELLGLAASGAGLLSLAIQLGESALKLRGIYHAARDAPRTVSKLAFGIETMALALRELEQRRQQTGSGGVLLARCLLECQQSTAEILELVDKMERHLEKHSRLAGRMYAVFRERDMKELLDDLEKAKSALQLAYMMFLDQEQRQRDSAHLGTLSQQVALIQDLHAQVSTDSTRLSQQLTALALAPALQDKSCAVISLTPQTQIATGGKYSPIEAGNPSNDVGNNGPRHVRGRGDTLPLKQSKQRGKPVYTRACLRLPTWLSRRVWDIAITNTQSSWNVYLRTYNSIPQASPVVYYCETGNLAGIQRLMDRGEASPLDVFRSNGGPTWTLLAYAALHRRLEVCRYLLGQTTWNGSVLSEALSHLGPSLERNYNEYYRLFMNDPGWDVTLDNSNHIPRWLAQCRSADLLSMHLLDHITGYESWVLDERLSLVSEMRYIEPSGFLMCVGLLPSDSRLALARTSTGFSALHYIARALQLYDSSDDNYQVQEELFNLGVKLIQNGADIYGICDGKDGQISATPLMYSLSVSSTNWGIGAHPSHLHRFQFWIRMVQRAGLDLCEYGARESKIWSTFRSRLLPRHHYSSYQLCGLIYGPSPLDWGLKLRKIEVYGLYERQSPPGSFPRDPRLPCLIVWPPTKTEAVEGPWKLIEEKCCASRDEDILKLLAEEKEKEPFCELMTPFYGQITKPATLFMPETKRLR
ncbi:hypothetical protein GQ53DRAFT_839721 [Thozetella sp. PMI_491]|nr:hypothetical protein GQ53DRAFT_839721 [Thozetella sp. PMI_491]